MITGRYRAVTRPAGTSHGHPAIVFDMAGKMHMPLTTYAKVIKDSTTGGTMQTYLSAILPFFTYLETDPWQLRSGRRWDGGVEDVRQAVSDYLAQKQQCRIRKHKLGFQVVDFAAESRNTVSVFLAALKRFYAAAIDKGYYSNPNPLTNTIFLDVRALLEQMKDEEEIQRGYPRMPQAGGTEEPRRRVRLTDSYFVVKGDQWELQTVDRNLAGKVLAGASQVKGWGLREELVTRMLFESGGRVAEVCALTVGDWEAKGLMREASAISKGSNGKRVKFLRWSDDTAKLLRRYFDTESRMLDPQGRTLDDYLKLHKQGEIDLLQVPLFLSERRKALTPKNYRRYWNAACAAAGIEADVHQARHWYVTEAIRNIYDHSRTEGELQRKLRELIGYMKWKSGFAMIEVYEHYLEAERHAEVQDDVHARLEEAKQQAMKELKRGGARKAKAAASNPEGERAPERSEMDDLYDFIVGGP